MPAKFLFVQLARVQYALLIKFTVRISMEYFHWVYHIALAICTVAACDRQYQYQIQMLRICRNLMALTHTKTQTCDIFCRYIISNQLVSYYLVSQQASQPSCSGLCVCISSSLLIRFDYYFKLNQSGTWQTKISMPETVITQAKRSINECWKAAAGSNKDNERQRTGHSRCNRSASGRKKEMVEVAFIFAFTNLC